MHRGWGKLVLYSNQVGKLYEYSLIIPLELFVGTCRVLRDNSGPGFFEMRKEYFTEPKIASIEIAKVFVRVILASVVFFATSLINLELGRCETHSEIYYGLISKCYLYLRKQ